MPAWCQHACMVCVMWQARQLLMDPAVAREFARLREEAEAKAQEVRSLQEELQAVHFSQESKAGRLLMAKCRALQVRHNTVLLQSADCTAGNMQRALKCMDRNVIGHVGCFRQGGQQHVLGRLSSPKHNVDCIFLP